VTSEVRVADQREHRLHKLAVARGQGQLPYRFPTDSTAAEIREAHGGLAPDIRTTQRVRLAGRVDLLRRQGGLSFAVLRDRTGTVQLFVDTALIGAAEHHRFDELDRGDWVGVEGTVMTTRRGELSVCVETFALLGKALLEPPDKHHGLTDVETRYRQRYVDLAANARTREIFRIRHATVRAIRRHLEDHGFTEVEGPVLGTIQGGASARPFVTHHNALDLDMYLRIALELHLKRLIVGGMDRVYEIGRIFRNEGISTRHNPEFTMLELYEAFADYTEMMAISEELVVNAARDALGTTVITIGETEVDLAEPWRRVRMVDLVASATGVEVHPSQPVDDLRALAERHGVSAAPSWGSGKIIEELFEGLCEASLIAPTFVTGHPVEISPLARADRNDPHLTERFEFFINGREHGNGYSELNDPAEQRLRFEDEQRAKDAGDAEAGTVDEDYLRALEYGLPPTGGLGIGVDRVAMLLAGVSSIKEVILFPTLRPEVVQTTSSEGAFGE
jgi:lysyl-tRNA synthetase, class II